MARPRAAHAAAPRDTRTTRSGLRRLEDRASEVGAHRRARRPAGTQLVARRLPDGVHRFRLRRPGRRARRPAPRQPGSCRCRPRSLASAAPVPARAALRRHGALPRPRRPGGPTHDVHLGVRAGVPGRRLRGAGPARARAALVAGAPAGRGPGGRVRELPAGRPQPHRLALHPAAHLDGDRSRPRGRSDPGRGTARRLDRPRPGRAGDVHTAGQRPVGRAGGTDVPGVDQIGLAETSDPRGSRLPRLDTVPAGQTARPSRTAHDRRAARGRRLDRAAGRDDGALRRPGGGRDRVPGREAAGRRTQGLPAPHNPLWIDAARYGLSDPELHEAALVCFAAALEALPRLGATAGVMDAVRAFFDRYVVRGRCPADDLLDRVRGTDSRPHGKDIRT